ncbi:MAG: AAA family ATPase [Phycisphaerales bacterium]
MSDHGLSTLRENITSVYIGNAHAVDQLLVCLLARGHALIEDVPGVGKTVLATTLARSLDCTFSRIQLTPDLLPADLLGVSVFDRERGEFEFKRGPVFANIVLADEINRTTPRTQSALLEAMSEGVVSVDGKHHPLGRPFMLVATQNPYAFEGTYPLPENQLDRFLMQIGLGYPSAADEARVIEQRPAETALPDLAPVMHAEDVVRAQQAVDRVRLDRSLVEYLVAFARATREHEGLRVGLSPRGSLALAQVARATAFLADRDYVVPEDIFENAVPVVAHRIVLRSSGAGLDHDAGRAIVEETLQRVASPA